PSIVPTLMRPCQREAAQHRSLRRWPKPGTMSPNTRGSGVTTQHWRMVLWGSMLTFTAWVMWNARLALLPFAVGAILAYALSPVVDGLASFIPARNRSQDKLRRGAMVLVLYLVFFGALGGIGVATVPTALNQSVDFFNDLPQIVDEARVQLT